MNQHIPVLLKEAIAYLNLSLGKIIIDATYGYGGHSREILKKIKPGGKLIAIDRDQESCNDCQNLSSRENSLLCICGNNAELFGLVRQHSIDQVDGILFDLGFSAAQVRGALRGFSFLLDGPLDMRMDQEQQLTASEIINNWEENEIAKILKIYGEERFAKRIARKIVEERKKSKILRTSQLVEVIKKATPVPYQHQKIHFATRTFQAIRIAVNDELNNLKKALVAAQAIVRPKGRIVVISFHSLEDRIVKHFFAETEKGCICPPKFPQCVCGKKPLLKIITRKPITPSEEELKRNPQARSAKMRVAELV